MALNDPYSRSEVYSKPETDAKLETVIEKMNTVEERIDHKFTLLRADIRHDMNEMMTTIQEGFLKIDKRFELVEKDINWLKGFVLLVLGAIVALYVQNGFHH